MAESIANRGDTGFPPRLLAFFALAFAWSWACWLLSLVAKAQSAFLTGALFLLGGFGPGIAAVVMVGYSGGRAELRAWLVRCLRWRVGWIWIALAFFLPLAVTTLGAAAHIALGGTIPRSPACGHGAMAAANFFLVFLVGGPLGEEFGWRGYAMPAMHERYGWRVASLVLGVLRNMPC